MCSFYHMELDPGSLVGSLYVPFMYSATSIIRTRSGPAKILCACVEGVTICIKWVWRLLNEGSRHVLGLKNARNDK